MSGSSFPLKSILQFLARLFGGSGTPVSPPASSPVSSPSPSYISPAGVGLIEHYEGLRLTAYRDPVGILTIGYGDTGGVYPGQTITQTEADARLKGRLDREFVPGVITALTRAPRQCELDAMVCLAYNIGVGAFGASTLVRKYNAGDTAGAADEFLRWSKAGGQSLLGLRKRRASERVMFRGGTLLDAIRAGDVTT